MGFGGNLVQGFRIYPWIAVPNFPQILLCFFSLALWPQPFEDVIDTRQGWINNTDAHSSKFTSFEKFSQLGFNFMNSFFCWYFFPWLVNAMIPWPLKDEAKILTDTETFFWGQIFRNLDHTNICKRPRVLKFWTDTHYVICCLHFMTKILFASITAPRGFPARKDRPLNILLTNFMIAERHEEKSIPMIHPWFPLRADLSPQ